jgi:hypothetical protein
VKISRWVGGILSQKPTKQNGQNISDFVGVNVPIDGFAKVVFRDPNALLNCQCDL